MQPRERGKNSTLSGAWRILLPALAMPVAAALAVSTLPSRGLAQPVADLERKLLPFRNTTLDTLPPSFWSGITKLRLEEERQRSLSASISVGFSGDDAGERSLYKLNTGISLSRGDFPSQLSVDSKLNLQVRDGSLQEDITTLGIDYDYNVSRRFEYFTFAHRFTDSFLSIAQRYEVGVGTRVAMSLGDMGGSPAMQAVIGETGSVIDAMSNGAASASINPAALAAQDAARFKAAAHDLGEAVFSRESRATIGLAVSAFAEIERAQLDLVSVPMSGEGSSITSSMALPSVQRYRLSVRPTLRVRPASGMTIRFFPYFKLPLSKQYQTSTSDGTRKYDYRRDIFTELSWAVKADERGAETLEFVVSLDDYYDNIPPELSADAIQKELNNGRRYLRTAAQKHHQFVALSLRLRW